MIFKKKKQQFNTFSRVKLNEEHPCKGYGVMKMWVFCS